MKNNSHFFCVFIWYINIHVISLTKQINMNKELRELFEKSKLTKKEFSNKIGISLRRFYAVLHKDAFELKPSTFKKYKSRLE